MKNVGYDDDESYDDDGYDSPDPEEQEFLQQCTAQVLQQLRAGLPSVISTKEEVQEALWHYYNDVEKSVNYIRGMLLADVGRMCPIIHCGGRGVFCHKIEVDTDTLRP